MSSQGAGSQSSQQLRGRGMHRVKLLQELRPRSLEAAVLLGGYSKCCLLNKWGRKVPKVELIRERSVRVRTNA